MDKILSTRIDESIARRIGHLARELKTTKKAVIESAIMAYAEQTEAKGKSDVLEQTFGAWQRQESTGRTVKRSRKAFQEGLLRYQK